MWLKNAIEKVIIYMINMMYTTTLDEQNMNQGGVEHNMCELLDEWNTT